MNKNLTDVSKFLSMVLRHNPQAIGLSLDLEGWADIETLLSCARQSGREISRELILQVVEDNDKQRFTLSPEGTRIRAAQGHSTNSVAIKYPHKIPPQALYHGTAERFLASIVRTGLTPQKRQHVHLSAFEQTALEVGKRYGKPILLIIPAELMFKDGIDFFQADNGVWLVKAVSPQWLLMANPHLANFAP